MKAPAPSPLSSSSKPRKWGRKAAFSALSVISIASMAWAVGASSGHRSSADEEIPGRRRERERAGVLGLAALGLGRLGIDQGDAETLRRELGKRERERAADETAAGDHHVEPIPGLMPSLRAMVQQCHVPPGA